LTTCVEDPVNQRSDCHAWSALPLYEFPAKILGVRPASAGYGKIIIDPFIGSLSWAKGIVSTAKGPVKVDWTVSNGIFSIKIEAPKDVEKIVVLPDTSIHKTTEGVIELICRLK
jgi:alpha-L-rhamnosidase